MDEDEVLLKRYVFFENKLLTYHKDLQSASITDYKL